MWALFLIHYQSKTEIVQLLLWLLLFLLLFQQLPMVYHLILILLFTLIQDILLILFFLLVMTSIRPLQLFVFNPHLFFPPLSLPFVYGFMLYLSFLSASSSDLMRSPVAPNFSKALLGLEWELSACMKSFRGISPFKWHRAELNPLQAKHPCGHCILHVVSRMFVWEII